MEFHLNNYIDSGKEDYMGYAYLCLDEKTKEISKKTALEKAEVQNANLQAWADHPNQRGRKPSEDKKIISTVDVLNSVKDAGVYILISSYEQTCEEAVKNYSMRDGIEKIFEIGKSDGKLLPLNVEKDETYRGHLLVTFIATVIISLLKKALKTRGISFQTALADMRNQKCKVFESCTVVQEVRKKQNDVYNTLGINNPVKI